MSWLTPLAVSMGLLPGVCLWPTVTCMASACSSLPQLNATGHSMLLSPASTRERTEHLRSLRRRPHPIPGAACCRSPFRIMDEDGVLREMGVDQPDPAAVVPTASSRPSSARTTPQGPSSGALQVCAPVQCCTSISPASSALTLPIGCWPTCDSGVSASAGTAKATSPSSRLGSIADV